MKKLILAAATIFAFSTQSALAVTQNIVFTGVVTNDVTDTIMLRQPDGSFQKYTGPVPDYPYKKGDQVTISFTADVAELWAPGSPFPRPADGLYRFQLTSDLFGGGSQTSSAFARNLDISGPIRTANIGAETSVYGGPTIVYNDNTKTFSLDFSSRTFGASGLDGPTLGYDTASGTAVTLPSTCFGGATNGCRVSGGFTLEGDATTFRGFPAPQRLLSNTTSNPGFFDWLGAGLFTGPSLSGSWNLPTFGSSGSTDVPEPGMMLLFGGGALALMRRRKRTRLGQGA